MGPTRQKWRKRRRCREAVAGITRQPDVPHELGHGSTMLYIFQLGVILSWMGEQLIQTTVTAGVKRRLPHVVVPRRKDEWLKEKSRKA